MKDNSYLLQKVYKLYTFNHRLKCILQHSLKIISTPSKTTDFNPNSSTVIGEFTFNIKSCKSNAHIITVDNKILDCAKPF